jgi:predicted DCC family thiol-disulfide oxidoreductase YuxK
MPVYLPPRLILFDGICHLCTGSVRFVIAHDPGARFSFASLQSAAGQEVLSRFDLPLAGFDSFIYIREGRVYQRSTAALRVARDIGGVWGMLFLFIIIPRPLRDWLYDLVAKNRYSLFGKRDTCMLPTPELQKRFL